MNKCYCPVCGSINHPKNKKCMVCGEKLKQMDQDLSRLVTGEAKGKVEGGIVSFILTFIQTHTYGVLLSITLVAVVVPNVLLANPHQGHEVTSKPSALMTTKVNKSGYADAKEIMNDFMKDLSLEENIEKYRYDTYFEVNQSMLNDRFNLFQNEIQKFHTNNQKYYIEYARHRYENASLPDVYKYGVGDAVNHEDIEGVEMMMVYTFICDDNICEDKEGVINAVFNPTNYFYFHFVKRDGNWYFYRASDDAAECLMDDTFYYYVHEGYVKRYPSIQESWEMQQKMEEQMNS